MAVCQGCCCDFISNWLQVCGVLSALVNSKQITSGNGNDKKWAHVVLRPEEILPSSDTSFLQMQTFQESHNLLSPTEPFTLLVLSFKASQDWGKIFPFFLYSLPPLTRSLFSFSSCLCSSLSLTPACSTVTQHQCNLNCDINSHMKCTRKRQV